MMTTSLPGKIWILIKWKKCRSSSFYRTPTPTHSVLFMAPSAGRIQHGSGRALKPTQVRSGPPRDAAWMDFLDFLD